MILRYRCKLRQHLLRIAILVCEYIPTMKINGDVKNHKDSTNLVWFSTSLPYMKCKMVVTYEENVK